MVPSSPPCSQFLPLIAFRSIQSTRHAAPIHQAHLSQSNARLESIKILQHGGEGPEQKEEAVGAQRGAESNAGGEAERGGDKR